MRPTLHTTPKQITLLLRICSFLFFNDLDPTVEISAVFSLIDKTKLIDFLKSEFLINLALFSKLWEDVNSTVFAKKLSLL